MLCIVGAVCQFVTKKMSLLVAQDFVVRLLVDVVLGHLILCVWSNEEFCIAIYPAELFMIIITKMKVNLYSVLSRSSNRL